MNITQSLLSQQDLHTSSLHQQFHTVPTEPRDESVVHDYSYEMPSNTGNKSAKGRLNAKLEEFSRELKQNASSKKHSKISQQSTPASNYNSRKSLQSRVVVNTNFENSQNVTKQIVKNNQSYLRLENSYAGEESETRIVQHQRDIGNIRDMSLIVLPNTPPNQNQEMSYSHFRSIDGIIQNPTQQPSFFYPSSGSNTQPFLFRQNLTNSVMISSGEHNSRVNILPKDEDLISLEESECAEMEDLNLSRTDEGGQHHMQSATSFTNNHRKQEHQNNIHLQQILISNPSSEQLQCVMPPVITPQNENLGRNKVMELRLQLEEIKKRQEEQALMLGSAFDTQDDQDEEKDHISSLKELSYLEIDNNLNDEYSNVKKTAVSKITQQNTSQHFETPVHLNNNAKILASQILKNYNQPPHQGIELNDSTFGNINQHFRTYQDAPTNNNCDSQYQRDEIMFEEIKHYQSNQGGGPAAAPENKFKTLQINNQGGGSANKASSSNRHYASVQSITTTSHSANKFNYLKNIIENSYKNKANQQQQQYTTLHSGGTNSISAVSQLTKQHHQISVQPTATSETMSAEEENQRLRQIIKVMEDNEKRMHSKMEEMLRKQERERGKWEGQMIHMQNEVAQLNEIIGSMTSEKALNARNPLRCQCRPRIKDLERQILNLHKQMYFLRRGQQPVLEVQDQENFQPNIVDEKHQVTVLASVIQQSTIRPSARDITPKSDGLQLRKISKSRSTSGGKKRGSSLSKKTQPKITAGDVKKPKTPAGLKGGPVAQTPKNVVESSKVPESLYKRNNITPKNVSTAKKQKVVQSVK